MRFAATHKAVSYLMVATAFLVLVLSGELPPALSILTGVGIVSSYFFDPQRYPFLQSRGYNAGLTTALALLLGLMGLRRAVRQAAEALVHAAKITTGTASGALFVGLLATLLLPQRRADEDESVAVKPAVS